MEFSRDILEKFPGICVAEGDIRISHIEQQSPALDAYKNEVSDLIRSRFTLDNVKDDPGFRAYRDFFWSVGIDPTKTRPASEALVRRILANKQLPTINTAVDAYNLASALSGVPIAAFDADTLEGSLAMRFAMEGESFQGIGMKEPVVLKRNQAILTDSKKIIASYPYRDSDATKVTMATKNMHIVSCGVPGIRRETVVEAYGICARNLLSYLNGEARGPLITP
jgi:DNA/RNA-binding domain of Phe-tRNA-synthetase-like protein